MLASGVVDAEFKPRLGQTKDYKLDICCFSGKHTVLMRKSTENQAKNQDNVSEWSNLSTSKLLFQ
jgi:hypothetical protein